MNSSQQSPTMTLDGLREEPDIKHLNQAVGQASSSDKSSIGSPQPTAKASSKAKDLERLLARCKESLKLKNSQIQTLKDSLGEVEKFKDYNENLKHELAELREAHETWTVSIAESKRILHQEIENKNNEIEMIKTESHDLQAKLNDSHNQVKQLKSNIQDLQSRLVSTSAAHQKERENLKRELTTAKNTALKQLQNEHDHNIERVKLDLEKSIEALKQYLFKRDEQIVKDAEQYQQLQSRNNSLVSDLDECNKTLSETSRKLEQSEKERDTLLAQLSELKDEIEQVRSATPTDKKLNDSSEESIKLKQQVESLISQLSLMESSQSDLKGKLEDAESSRDNCEKCQALQEEIRLKDVELSNLNCEKCRQLEEEIKLKNVELSRDCEKCSQLKSELERNSERSEQLVSELNTRLDSLTTTNNELKTKVVAIRLELETTMTSYNGLKTEFDNFRQESERLEEVRRLEDIKRIEEAKRLEEARRLEEAQRQDEARRSEETKLLEDARQLEEAERLAEIRRLEETKRQEEIQRLKETQESLAAQLQRNNDAAIVPDSTQFEYLRNISKYERYKNSFLALSIARQPTNLLFTSTTVVYQFMLGKEPLVLARVISAVLKFDQNQIEQVCKIQEAIHTLGQLN